MPLRTLFLQSQIHRLSSVLAIAGGISFTVLPVAFMTGIASIGYPPLHWGCSAGIRCFSPIDSLSQPLPELIPSWASLGIVGILLGLLVLKTSSRLRVGVAPTLLFSLGSMTLLLGVVTNQILESFITTPGGFLVFPELSVVAMAGATALFFYENLRGHRKVMDTASFLAISGGLLFLVLPLAFSRGTVSIVYPVIYPVTDFQCLSPPCICHGCGGPIWFRPTPMITFWTPLGVFAVLLGLVPLILSERTRAAVVLGLAISLGMISLFFWTLSSRILQIFIITPPLYRLFPELSVAAMAGATVLLSLEFWWRWGQRIPAITS